MKHKLHCPICYQKFGQRRYNHVASVCFYKQTNIACHFCGDQHRITECGEFASHIARGTASRQPPEERYHPYGRPDLSTVNFHRFPQFGRRTRGGEWISNSWRKDTEEWATASPRFFYDDHAEHDRGAIWERWENPYDAYTFQRFTPQYESRLSPLPRPPHHPLLTPPPPRMPPLSRIQPIKRKWKTPQEGASAREKPEKTNQKAKKTEIEDASAEENFKEWEDADHSELDDVFKEILGPD